MKINLKRKHYCGKLMDWEDSGRVVRFFCSRCNEHSGQEINAEEYKKFLTNQTRQIARILEKINKKFAK